MVTNSGFHSGTVKKNIQINCTLEQAWKNFSDIGGLPKWLIDVKKTIFLTKKKKGVGAIRLITFDDGTEIEEHVVFWNEKQGFTYVATSGLPLRAYVATISIKKITPKKIGVTWQSYLNSEEMSKKQFQDFQKHMGEFYLASLKQMKRNIED